MEKTMTPRIDDKPNSARPQTDRSMNSARSNIADLPDSSRSMETFRTSMSTARVQTVLAALSAEKQALLSKLQTIDAALESGAGKKMKTRTGK
ncbi:hypothetical protein EON65_14320 [archaeon]|nr:MAG: hypothetical protein EON65_14320 [archaeon]